MTLTQRRLVQAIAPAEQGDFRRARHFFGISQPALTKNIQALESALGIKLFDRQATTVTLTALANS